MSWVAKSMQLDSFYQPPGPGLIARLKNDTFAEDGTVVTTCWWRNAELPVESAYARKDQAGIDRMKADLEYLLGKAKRFTVGGDECVYWEHPVEGQWKPEWGGKPVVTLHNCYGWSVGMAIIDLYRHERNPALLPIIDGIYNWTPESADVLHIHLLNWDGTGSAGLTSGTDNQNVTDQFNGQGVLIDHWTDLDDNASKENLVYKFSLLPDGRNILPDLNSYASDGYIAFGIDPDCHYFNDGIEFKICTSVIPAPGAILLGGIGVCLVGWLKRRKTL
jgi:hypothetical protein